MAWCGVEHRSQRRYAGIRSRGLPRDFSLHLLEEVGDGLCGASTHRIAGFTIHLWGGSEQATFANMLVVDKFALFFKLLFTVMAALVILASTDYVSRFDSFQGEYYALGAFIHHGHDADFRSR